MGPLEQLQIFPGNMELDFSCITHNTWGLKQKHKRVKIFNYLKEKVSKGIVFLQETHSVKNDLQKWKREWEGNLLLNHGTSNSRGNLIAFTKNFDYKLLKYVSDGDGRIQICSILYEEKKLLLVNIYNENLEQKQVTLLKKLEGMLESFLDVPDHE